MAWSAPRTWVVGELVTANMMNTFIRDNQIQLYDGMPAARVYNTGVQSIPDSADTALLFPSERFDTEAIHDTVSNTSRLTCKTAGKYLIIGDVGFAANAAGLRDTKIRLTGATLIAVHRHQVDAGVGAQVHVASVSTLYDIAVDDYVELVVFQSSGGALNTSVAANAYPEFMMVKVG